MRLLHVHSGNIFGGVERMLQTLAPATAGRTPLTSSFALCFDGQISEVLVAAGATVYKLGTVRTSRLDQVWHARRALRKLLETGAWDVVCVHSSWSQAIFGSTIVQSGIPLVRWLHAPEPGPWWLDAGARAARPALVLCNSYYTHDAAKTALGTLPAAVHYPPIRIPDSGQSDREAVRAEIGVTAETPVIAIAARMEPWKGHRLLLDGLRRLTDIPWQAWIIGGAQRPSERAYFDELVALAGRTDLRDRVQFLGQRTDVPRLLGAADLYCQPNEGPEPFGLSFVEALSAGLPVVTTRSGAAPEIVDRNCGVLVEPNSPAALADALRPLLTDHTARRAMSVAARARAAEFCDLSRSLPALKRHLNRAIAASATVHA